MLSNVNTNFVDDIFLFIEYIIYMYIYIYVYIYIYIHIYIDDNSNNNINKKWNKPKHGSRKY